MSKDKNAAYKLANGVVLNGRYEIRDLLGSGGFGNTYLASDLRFSASNVYVCVKEFFFSGEAIRGADGRTVLLSNPSKQASFEDLRQRFRREAERMFMLHDEHIVRVSDLFDENGTSYYVMDYVDGRSLAQIVDQSGAIEERQALGYILQLLQGLRVIHRIGMIHLDIKPGNVMVTKEGKIVLIDFGASKITDPGSSTLSTVMLNTPGYAPLEQTLVRLDRIGQWTDLYAVGGTLYKLITGSTPADAQSIIDDGEAAFKFPDIISQPVRQLIFWLMNKRISERPHSTEEVISRVESIIRQAPAATVQPQSQAPIPSMPAKAESAELAEESEAAAPPPPLFNTADAPKPQPKPLPEPEEAHTVILSDKPKPQPKSAAPKAAPAPPVAPPHPMQQAPVATPYPQAMPTGMPTATPAPQTPYPQAAPPYAQPQPAYGAPMPQAAPAADEKTQVHPGMTGRPTAAPVNPFTEKPKKKSHLGLIIGIIVAVIVGLAVFLFLAGIIGDSSSSSPYGDYFDGEETTESSN